MDVPVIIFYDGLCPLCSREIAHYRGRVDPASVSFVDIAGPDFDAAAHQIDIARAQEVLHVKVGDEMRTGIEAVISMWEAVPAYRWLGRLARTPGIYLLARAWYFVFARFRPYLQRRKRCESGTCAR